MSMFAFCDFPRITCSRTMYLCVLPFFEFCQFVRFVILYLCYFLEDRCLSFCDSYKIANGHNMQFGRFPYLGKTWFLEIVFWVVQCSVIFNFSKSIFSDVVTFSIASVHICSCRIMFFFYRNLWFLKIVSLGFCDFQVNTNFRNIDFWTLRFLLKCDFAGAGVFTLCYFSEITIPQYSDFWVMGILE